MTFPTLRELAEKAKQIVEKAPELADLEVYGYDDGSINLDGFDDIMSLTIDELRQRNAKRNSQ